jgi:hypothetical protein
MVLTCSKCSRANPSEAAYCYYDGFVLGGAGGGPLAVSRQAFPSPFVFSSGRTCRSFDELAIACQEEWVAASEMLTRGFLENFFGGLGRLDLVAAAKEAAKFPDRDRGLDMLLGKLPTSVLADPSLKVEPLEMNLGVLSTSTERRFDLHLENSGMRIIYGSVNSSEGWLALGDGDGASEKHFQFHHEQNIPVRVRLERLRAGNKPQEARLLVQSNAGACEVVIRAERSVVPFASGTLAGAKSPRQIAEKAKANPKEAATLFENGTVAQWYEDNGWTYPVQGPSASGLGAVQQFFEALGLTAPPKVQISEKRISFEGNPGDALSYTLQVSSEEKRAVYAHAISDQPWLEVSRAKLNGRVATLQLSVPAVPNHPGESLKARLRVQSNGNQRFVVSVTLHVGSQFDFTTLHQNTTVPPPPVRQPSVPVPQPPAAAPPPTPPGWTPAASTLIMPPGTLPLPPISAPPPSRRHRGKPARAHLIPAIMLVLALLGLMAYDFFAKEPEESQGGGLGLQYKVQDPDPVVNFVINPEKLRFGLVLTKETDPGNRDEHKRLTYRPDGSTNNTCIKIEGYENLYGFKGIGRQLGLPKQNNLYWATSWLYPENIGKVLVKQEVQMVPGAQSGKIDTCLIHYTVENQDRVPHHVGLRVMIDTYIGANDGVPFTLSNRSGLVNTPQELAEKDVPDYIQALEHPDPGKPGTVAYMGLRGLEIPNVQLEPISKVIIRKFPSSESRWEEEIPADEKGKVIDDSCVLLFWKYREMQLGETRHMAFSYGLNAISTPDGAGNLSLTAGGSFVTGKDFTITAYVKKPEEGEKVTLADLPPGLNLASGTEATQTVAAKGDYTQVSWRVHSEKAGEYLVNVFSSRGSRVGRKVNITNGSLFR